MFLFSPRPWKISGNGYIITSGTSIVARIERPGRTPEANWANARLIWGAPEMYDILERIMALSQRLDEGEPYKTMLKKQIGRFRLLRTEMAVTLSAERLKATTEKKDDSL